MDRQTDGLGMQKKFDSDRLTEEKMALMVFFLSVRDSEQASKQAGFYLRFFYFNLIRTCKI